MAYNCLFSNFHKNLYNYLENWKEISIISPACLNKWINSYGSVAQW